MTARIVNWLILVAACGGGGGATGGDATGSDVGGGGDAGRDSGGTGGDAARPTHAGFASIQSYDAMNSPGTPTRGGTASAGFFASGDYCTVSQTIGPCQVEICTSTAPPAVSAGTITLTGAAQPITLTPAADRTYATFTVQTPLFAGGESITFAASGADVPAFTTSLTTPGKATITSPAKPNPFLAVSRASGLTVTWTGGGSGMVQVVLLGGAADPRLFCRFSASAGTGTVPAGAIATIAASQGGYAMASIADTEHDAGDWAVDISAYYNAVWPDDAIVSGPATFH